MPPVPDTGGLEPATRSASGGQQHAHSLGACGGLEAGVCSLWEAGAPNPGATCASVRYRVSIGAVQASRRPPGEGACLVRWWQRVSQLVLFQMCFLERLWEGTGCSQGRGVWMASLRPQLQPPAERGPAQVWRQ